MKAAAHFGLAAALALPSLLLGQTCAITSPTASQVIQAAAPVQLTATVSSAPTAYSLEYDIDGKRWIKTYNSDQHQEINDFPDSWQGSWTGLWYSGLNGDGPHTISGILRNIFGATLATCPKVNFTVRIEGMSNQYFNAAPNLSGNQVSGTGTLGVITYDGANDGQGFPAIDGYYPQGSLDPLYNYCGFWQATSQTGGWKIPNLVTSCYPNGLREVIAGTNISNIADPYVIPLTFTRSGNNISFSCSNTVGCHDSYQGSVVTFSTTGTLPAPLVAGCQYYWTTSASNPSNTASVSITGTTLTATLSSGCGLAPGVPVYIRNIQQNGEPGFNSFPVGQFFCDGYYIMATGSGTSFTVTVPAACAGAGSNHALEIDVNPYFAIYVDANNFEVSASCSPCIGMGQIAPGPAVTLTNAGTGTQTVTQRMRSDYWTGTGFGGQNGNAAKADWASAGGPAFVIHRYDFENGNAPMQLHPLYWEMHVVAGASATPLCNAATLIQNTDLSFTSMACNATGVSWTEVDDGGQSGVCSVNGSGNVTGIMAGWCKVVVACASCAAGGVSLPPVTVYVEVHSGSVTFPHFTTCGVIAQAFNSGLPSGCKSFHPNSLSQIGIEYATAYFSNPVSWYAQMFAQSGFNSAMVGAYIGSNILNPSATGADTWGAMGTRLYYQEQFAAANNIRLEYDMYNLYFQTNLNLNGGTTNILSLAAILNNTGYNRQASLAALISHMASTGLYWKLYNDDEVTDILGVLLQPDPAIGGANWTNAVVSGSGINFNMVNPPSVASTWSQSAGTGEWVQITGATNACLNGWYPILTNSPTTQWTTNNNGACGNGTYAPSGGIVENTAKMVINPSHLGTPNANNQQNVSPLPGALGQTQTCWSGAGGCSTSGSILTSVVVSSCVATVNWAANAIPNTNAIRIWGATTAHLNIVAPITSGTNSFTFTYPNTSQEACPANGTYTSATDPNLYITVDPNWGPNPLGNFYSIVKGVANHPAISWSILGSFFSTGNATVTSYERDPNKTDSAWDYIPSGCTAIYGPDCSVHDWMVYSNSSSGIASRAYQTRPRAMLISLGYVGGGNTETICQSFTFNPGCDRPAQLDWRPETTIAQVIGMKTIGIVGNRIYNFYSDTGDGYTLLCCGWYSNGGFTGEALSPYVNPKQWAAISRTNALLNLRTDTELQPEANKPYLGPFFQTDAHTSATYGNELTILCGSESPYGQLTISLPQISGGAMLKYILTGYSLNVTVMTGNPSTDRDEFCSSPGRATTYVALPATPAVQPIDNITFAPPATLPFGASKFLLQVGYYPKAMQDDPVTDCTTTCTIAVDHHNIDAWYRVIYADSNDLPRSIGDPVKISSQGLF